MVGNPRDGPARAGARSRCATIGCGVGDDAIGASDAASSGGDAMMAEVDRWDPRGGGVEGAG